MSELDYVELTTLCIENEKEGQKIMVFDWIQAAQIITEYNIINAEAFIRGDEMRTAGRIINQGHLVADHDAILESYLDEPTLRNCDTGDEWPCYTYKASTNWTAQAILKLTGGELS